MFKSGTPIFAGMLLGSEQNSYVRECFSLSTAALQFVGERSAPVLEGPVETLSERKLREAEWGRALLPSKRRSAVLDDVLFDRKPEVRPARILLPGKLR